jgi:hypothetical protein
MHPVFSVFGEPMAGAGEPRCTIKAAPKSYDKLP